MEDYLENPMNKKGNVAITQYALEEEEGTQMSAEEKSAQMSAWLTIIIIT